jgi:hypothetical protein
LRAEGYAGSRKRHTGKPAEQKPCDHHRTGSWYKQNRRDDNADHVGNRTRNRALLRPCHDVADPVSKWQQVKTYYQRGEKNADRGAIDDDAAH